MSSLLDGKPSAPAALSSLPFEKVAKRIFTCKFNCWLPARDRPSWAGNGHHVALTDFPFFFNPGYSKASWKKPTFACCACLRSLCNYVFSLRTRDTYTHTHTFIYIYIYIYRERERERENNKTKAAFCAPNFTSEWLALLLRFYGGLGFKYWTADWLNLLWVCPSPLQIMPLQ